MKSPTQKARQTTPEERPKETPPANDVADDEPTEDPEETDELGNLDPDDQRWDAFIPDDDERDPQPDYGDFWFEA